MMITCPKCGELQKNAQIDLATDVAVCQTCRESFAISVAIGTRTDDDFDLAAPPKGASFTDHGTGWELWASSRSWLAVLLVPFVCCLVGGLTGVYGRQMAEGQLDLVDWLGGIAFLLFSLLMVAITVMSICGKVLISVEGNAGRVFTGAGPVGYTQQFEWSTVTRIDETIITDGDGWACATVTLILDGRPPLKLGVILSDARRHYVVQALQTMLQKRGRG